MSTVNTVGVHSFPYGINSMGKEFTQDEIRDIIIKQNKDGKYSEKENFDHILNGIKRDCFLFLDNIEHADSITEQSIMYAMEFLNREFNRCKDLQSSLNIPYFSCGFTELHQTVDELMLAENEDRVIHEVVGWKLAKDISSLIDNISFCIGTLRMMNLYKRNM